MKKTSQLIIIAGTMGLLAACSATMNQNSMIQRVVTSHKLKNGKALQLGYKAPAMASQCTQVNSESYNWSLQRMEGMVKLGGGYQELKDRAIAYANNHTNVNYVYLEIPNEYSVGGIEVTALRKAYIHYYQCKFPPATHHNPFK